MLVAALKLKRFGSMKSRDIIAAQRYAKLNPLLIEPNLNPDLAT
jgi:hypothetical protein